MRTKYVYPLFVFLLLSGLNTTSLSQTIPTDIKNLTIGADVILTGKVSKQNSTWNKDKTRIFTEVTVEVEEYLKGNSGNKTIVVTTLGGEVGEVGELYTHMPTFKEEEEMVLFVKMDKKDGKYRVYDGENGKININQNKSTDEEMKISNKRVKDLKNQIKSYVNE